MGDTAAIFQSMGQDRGVRKYFPPRRSPPPKKKTLLQGLVVLGLPLSIEIQHAHSLTHSPFPSFLLFFPLDPRSPNGIYLRGEIHAHSIFYSTRLVSLEIEVLFSPFLFFLWRIRDRKQALLLALNPLSSLSLCPRVFPVGERRLD